MTSREQALTHLLTTSTKGEDFIKLAVRDLAHGLGWAAAGIGRLSKQGDQIKPLWTWCGGKFISIEPYDLKGSPCAEAYWSDPPRQIYLCDLTRNSLTLPPGLTGKSFRGMRLRATSDFDGHVWAVSEHEYENSDRDQEFFAAITERIAQELEHFSPESPVFYRAQLDELLKRYREPVLIMHTDGRIVSTNGAGRALLGLEESTPHKAHLRDFHGGHAVGVGTEYLQQIVGQGISRFELLLRGADNREFPAEVLALLIESDGQVLIQAILRDISRRRRQQASQQQYLTMLSVTREMMALIDPSLRFLAVNEAYVRLFERPREEIIDRPVAELHGEELFERYFKASLMRAFEGKVVSFQTWIPYNGSLQYVVGRYYPVFGQSGDVEAVVAVHRSNTREQRLQESLLEIATSREVNQGDVRAAIRLATRRVADAFRVQCAEVWILPRHQSRLLCTSRYRRDEGAHSEGDRLTAAKTKQLLAALDTHQSISHHDLVTGSRSTDNEASLETGIRVLGRLVGTLRLRDYKANHDWRDSDRALFGEIAQQVAQALLNRERRDLERQLEQSKQRESLGVMAGGIAHDFNNLLVSILGGAELAALDISPQHPAREQVDLIRKSALRASDLCHQMLAYAGRASFQRNVVDLNDEVYTTAQVMRGRLSDRVSVSYDSTEELPRVKVDTAQIHQVITNLLVNAADAYGAEAGTINLRTGVVHGSELEKIALTMQPESLDQSFVFLDVADEGAGMSEIVQAQMFDPFFTTKSTGRGLGLAAVLGIVQAHRGGISIASRVGKGTSVRVYLPASDEELEIPAKSTQSDETVHETCRIMVVDDEERVRQVATRILSRSGFPVVSAGSGQEAIEIFNREGETIELVLLDLKMPGIDGVETLHRLRESRPHLPAVLSSGFAEEEVVDRLGQTDACCFLKKPYLASELLGAVRTGQGFIRGNKGSFSGA